MSGSATGSSPNWVAGYVPPAGEWNQWWARKMDADNTVFAGGPFLSTQGGTMTGPVYLPPANPVDPNEAVRKGYVDSLTFAAGPFMPMTGGIFSGPVQHTSSLELAGNPVNPLDAAPKQYVDSAINQSNNALNVANAAVRRAGDTMTGLLTLSSDPVAANNAATKSYADTKVARAGDTMTGPLTVTGQVNATSVAARTNLYVNEYNNYEWVMTVDPNTGNHHQVYRTGWFDAWISADGTRVWIGGVGNLMTLDGTGVFGTRTSVNTGIVNTVTLNASGGVGVAGTLTAGAISAAGFSFYNNGNQIMQHTAGWYDEWVTVGGQRNWVGGNIVQMSLNPAGTLSVRGNISAGGDSYAANQVSTGALYAMFNNGVNAMYFGGGGSGRVLQMQSNWYFDFSPSAGHISWVADGGVAFIFNNTNGKFYNNRGPFAGAGAYENNSDERAKHEITPASCGLSEILSIEPIEFARDIHPERREIGFSAQQLRTAIPLAVSEEGPAVKGVEPPVLAITMEPVIAALVNGMKELAADVAALKAAR